MNRRTLDKCWVWIGLLIGLLPALGYAQKPEIGLEVLSIFFGGLLAIASILPSVQNYEKIKFIKESGHMKDLLQYIHLSLILSFILIVSEFLFQILILNISSRMLLIIDSIYLALWGVFFLSLLRLVVLVIKIVNND